MAGGSGGGTSDGHQPSGSQDVPGMREGIPGPPEFEMVPGLQAHRRRICKAGEPGTVSGPDRAAQFTGQARAGSPGRMERTARTDDHRIDGPGKRPPADPGPV
ncbi:MAG: hypothetical protein MPJ22_00090 [Pirellulales bacterium]|nr:hypothetical protein [Pirellulales bacterium]